MHTRVFFMYVIFYWFSNFPSAHLCLVFAVIAVGGGEEPGIHQAEVESGWPTPAVPQPTEPVNGLD